MAFSLDGIYSSVKDSVESGIDQIQNSISDIEDAMKLLNDIASGSSDVDVNTLSSDDQALVSQAMLLQTLQKDILDMMEDEDD